MFKSIETDEGIKHLNIDAIDTVAFFKTPNNKNHTASFTLDSHRFYCSADDLRPMLPADDFIRLEDAFAQDDGKFNTVWLRSKNVLAVEGAETDSAQEAMGSHPHGDRLHDVKTIVVRTDGAMVVKNPLEEVLSMLA